MGAGIRRAGERGGEGGGSGMGPGFGGRPNVAAIGSSHGQW